jgi:hypothetical protein
MTLIKIDCLLVHFCYSTYTLVQLYSNFQYIIIARLRTISRVLRWRLARRIGWGLFCDCQSYHDGGGGEGYFVMSRLRWIIQMLWKRSSKNKFANETFGPDPLVYEDSNVHNTWVFLVHVTEVNRIFSIHSTSMLHFINAAIFTLLQMIHHLQTAQLHSLQLLSTEPIDSHPTQSYST